MHSTPAQERIAKAYVAQLTEAKVFKAPIVTRIEPLKGFYPAEGYHQDFMVRNPNYPYIVINDRPKVEQLKRVYPALYREAPVSLSSAR
jgi:peptide-methionine (S)-S-oxide reductase